MTLPNTLLKPESSNAVVRRARRTITFLGVLNVLLAFGIVGVTLWANSKDRFAPAIRGTDAVDAGSGGAVRISVPLKALAENRILSTTDVIASPLVTIYGKIEDYAKLRSALTNFTVTVRQTSVTPNASSGEFAENVILDPGENQIPIVIGWDGVERYRYTYAVTYEPKKAASSTPALIIP